MGRMRGVPVAGAALGLTAAAALTLGYGWLNREPAQPFLSDRADLTAVLRLTTAVVAAAALIGAGCRLLGPIGQRSPGRRALFRAWSAPALAVLAGSGLIALNRGGTAQLFAAAAAQQRGLHPAPVTGAARVAWWCACLAVAVLALAGLFGYRPADREPAARPPAWGIGAAAVTALTATVIAVVVVAAVRLATAPAAQRTAPPVEPPPAPALTGAVAYRFEAKNLVAAGPGFARLADPDRGYSYRSVVGYDGETGRPRWTYRLPDPGGEAIRSGGVGPDSVVVVSTGLGGHPAVIALDATTGAPLWARPDTTLLGGDRNPVSAGLVLATDRVAEQPGRSAARGTRLLALSARTGALRWTWTFDHGCDGNTFLTDEFVLTTAGCDYGPGQVATVLDAATGAQRGMLSAAGLGVDPAALGPGVGSMVLTDAVGGTALVTVSRYRPVRSDVHLVVDIGSGRARRTVPAGYGPSFIDARSLLLVRDGDSAGAPPDWAVAILDLGSGAIVSTPLYYRLPSAARQWRPVARFGTGWATFLPDRPFDGPAARLPVQSLKSIDAAGRLRVFDNPCPGDPNPIPGVGAVPGALLVDCGDGYAGVR